MGIYLVSVDAAEWFDDDEDSCGELAAALNEELVRRGLAPYTSVPAAAPLVRGSGRQFEEKLVPPMDGFVALCETHLSPAECETLYDWTCLVPISLEEPIRLPISSGYTDDSVVAGAPQVSAIAERLASAVELPPEVPKTSDNLDLTMWFLDGPAKELAQLRPGPWSADLDAAFHVALFLRAAQHSLRCGAPLIYV
ncbi:MAG: hypothetical protein HOV87_07580 [Catenulispora sp.]|nr:hypothetical protein [Catenulispora sp.]